ncbi:thiamine-monophosphate kinase [bacterium BMS3Abin07]|nr:thiamine-monophosphate kinase [bacterium BMS3Abin07]GBE31974.1 thiamine-monophosphate kinase [bacterium BMS3Bbin05]
MLISELGELALIEKIRGYFSIGDSGVLIAIGDDAAVFSADKKNIVTTSDLMSEGVHFDYTYTTFYQVGFRLVISNVSDIYAMGAVPSYLFLNMALTGKRSEEEFDDFLKGVREACEHYNAKVLGGDLSLSIKGDFYSATLIGFADRVKTRSGAKPGHNIFITGNTGDSAAGLAYLKYVKKRIPMEKNMEYTSREIDGTILDTVRRHLIPCACNPETFIDKIKAMIDISDGLLLDLYRICAESRAGALIYRDNIPVSDGVRAIASMLEMDYMDFVLSGGEDYELIITSDSDHLDDCILIGKIIKDGFFFVDSDGIREKFVPKGYTHF